MKEILRSKDERVCLSARAEYLTDIKQLELWRFGSLIEFDLERIEQLNQLTTQILLRENAKK
jgi:hypothetical protein